MREQIIGDNQRERIQARINHYFARNRKELELTQAQMAKRLGYSKSAYRVFESSSGTDNKIISSLETIKKFADIEGMDASDFICFLEKGRIREANSHTKKLRRWETNLIAALDGVDSHVRHQWSESLMRCRKNSLAIVLKVMTKVMKLPYDKIDAIGTLSEPEGK